MLLTSEHTPCEVLFDTLKKKAGIAHKELAPLILSNRPLGDGRSPIEHAKDRTWLSHVIVHAPLGAQQERYFADFGVAAQRILNLLQSRKSRAMDSEHVLAMLSDASPAMQQALALAHQDANLYRNAFGRLLEQSEVTSDVRAEDCMVLFVAAGCSVDARLSVAYALDYAQTHHGGSVSTPAPRSLGHAGLQGDSNGASEAPTLGIVRVSEGYVVGDVHWASNKSEGFTIGAFATGPYDVTEVGDGVSGEHARIWCNDEGTWLVEDLGSTNGTQLVDGESGKKTNLVPHKPQTLHAGDELLLAGTTTFSVIQGWDGR